MPPWRNGKSISGFEPEDGGSNPSGGTHSGVAQLVEQRAVNPLAVSSNLTSGAGHDVPMGTALGIAGLVCT